VKRIITVASVLLLLLVFVAIYSLGQVPEERPQWRRDPILPEAAPEPGKGIYTEYCALCHGEEGEGYLADEANALANQDFLKSATDDFLFEAIVRGRPGSPMSAWGKNMGGVLPDADVRAVIAFLRWWQKEPPVDLSVVKVGGDAERGGRIYKKWCAACHGRGGEGASALSLNNPVFQETAGDGFLVYAISKGRRGTSMSSFSPRLSSQEIEDVVAFIRTLESNAEPAAVDSSVDIAFTPERLEQALMNPGMPLAEFSPRDNRYVPIDLVYEAYEQKRSFIILDARPYNDYLRAHVKGAVSVPFYDVEKAIDYLPRDVWIIAYCVCPHAMSGKALDALRQAGFEKTAILDEGFQEWVARGYPIITG
jgi:cytochrome c oxidase cbb3-type subunit 3